MAPPATARSSSHAVFVAAGIFLSRIFGLVRQRVLAHYLGLGDASDAFGAAFRIPNLLQNLLGEGVLSASFIPVYARLRAEGRDEEADTVAGTVFGLLVLTTAVVVLAGVLLAAPLTDVIAPGWSGPKRDLTIRLVRLLFPGAALLVFSAWCLGVLNSHRRFLLSYTAPVLWNLAIIATLVFSADRITEAGAATAAAIGSVIGSALQFLVQLPTVLRLLGRFRPALSVREPQVHSVLRSFGPVLLGRGVVQVSAFVDTQIASLLGTGAVAGINAAQVLYTLPVSLFGMAVSAAELPAMSSATGSTEEVAAALRGRLAVGLRRIAFFVIPSAVAFVAFGGLLAGALFQTGRFTADDSRFVWGILAGGAIGLLAATLGRLYSSTFYALRDTRTPLRFAVVRVLAGAGLGIASALWLPRAIGVDPRWGAAALTAASGLAAILEYLLLRRGLSARIGTIDIGWDTLTRLWFAAAAAAACGWGALHLFPSTHAVLRALVGLAPYSLAYLGLTLAFRIPEAHGLLDRLRRR